MRASRPERGGDIDRWAFFLASRSSKGSVLECDPLLAGGKNSLSSRTWLLQRESLWRPFRERACAELSRLDPSPRAVLRTDPEVPPELRASSSFPPAIWVAQKRPRPLSEVLGGGALCLFASRRTDLGSSRWARLMAQFGSAHEGAWLGGWTSPLELLATQVLLDEAPEKLVLVIPGALDRISDPVQRKIALEAYARGATLLGASPGGEGYRRTQYLERNQVLVHLASAALGLPLRCGSGAWPALDSLLAMGKPLWIPEELVEANPDLSTYRQLARTQAVLLPSERALLPAAVEVPRALQGHLGEELAPDLWISRLEGGSSGGDWTFESLLGTGWLRFGGNGRVVSEFPGWRNCMESETSQIQAQPWMGLSGK